MPLSFEIAWKYLRRPTDSLISAVGLVSILGLVIGVMALVISMALMTGYRNDLEQKLLGGNAELFVYAIEGTIEDTDDVVRTIQRIDGIAEAAPVVFHQALVTSESHTTGEQVMMKGIDPERARTSPMLAKIVGRSETFATSDGTPGIAVGKFLAQKLEIAPGASLTVAVPSQDSGSFLPHTGSFVVTRIFETGFFEFDARWLFLDLAEAQTLLNMGSAGNLIEIKLGPGASLDKVLEAVELRTGNRFAVTDWRKMNGQLFEILKIQQVVLFIVIGLIVFVSTFNIVSTLIMTVHEKRKEIGILISMGGDRRFIRQIFIWYGTLVGFVGTTLGVILGIAVCQIITRFELVSFGPEIAEVYFVTSIPFLNRVTDLAAISLFAIVVSYLATLIPSMRAARLNPIDALRYE